MGTKGGCTTSVWNMIWLFYYDCKRKTLQIRANTVCVQTGQSSRPVVEYELISWYYSDAAWSRVSGIFNNIYSKYISTLKNQNYVSSKQQVQIKSWASGEGSSNFPDIFQNNHHENVCKTVSAALLNLICITKDMDVPVETMSGTRRQTELVSSTFHILCIQK